MLVPRLTAEPRSGGDLRSLRFAQALARRSQLTVIVVGPPVDPPSLVAAIGAHQVLWFPGNSGIRGRLVALVRRWPLAVVRAWNAQARARVRDELQAGSRLVVDFLDPLAMVDEAAPHILNLHNVEADLASVGRLGGGWRGFEQRLERHRMGRWERHMLKRPQMSVVVPTDREAQALPVSAHVGANGTDIPDSPPQVPDGGTLLFVGALDYPPNADALVWWATEIAPRLTGLGLPSLTVVGRGHEQFVRQHPKARDLSFAGVVDDVRPWLAAATVSVAPVRHGGGTRIKLLEAFANARPVVTTSKGAEGLPVTDGVHVTIADSAEGFAGAVVELWTDANKREQLGSAAHRLSLDYDWQALGSAFADIVLGVDERS